MFHFVPDMKIYLGNSIRLPLQPTLQVIQEIPADYRAEPARRPDSLSHRLPSASSRRKAPAKS
jgi:hypothetical protein